MSALMLELSLIPYKLISLALTLPACRCILSAPRSALFFWAHICALHLSLHGSLPCPYEARA